MPQAFKVLDSCTLQELSITAHPAACASPQQMDQLIGPILCSMV